MDCLRSGRCRKRKVQTLGLLAVIAVLYFLLQFFTIARLNTFQGRKGSDGSHGSQSDNIPVIVQDAQKMADLPEALIVTVHDSPKALMVDKVEQLSRAIPVPRGVHPSAAGQYLEDLIGMFQCLQSKEKIPLEQVNDNYCDCQDSTDEPGTNACPDGRFFCQVQLPQRGPQWVHASKVNDGICDCCDGSDEWAGQEVPPLIQLKGKRGAVFHTPCTDRCGDIKQLMADERRIREQGLTQQQRYRDAAKQLSHREQQNYGPGGIFYLLSQQCHEHATREYKYVVCPFQSVKQSNTAFSSTSNTVLGRSAAWAQQKPGDFLLTMGGGDATLCPDGQPRQTQLRFLCGLEDRVISIHEDEKCRYFIKFSSPAAC